MRGFRAIAGFPNVIGPIDCTHIAIEAATVEEFAYVNRNGYHTINIQLICDVHLSLLKVVANWPSGTHDSSIVQNSIVDLHPHVSAIGDGWLIGECLT